MSLKISRVLHAGYVFEASATSIIFDPIFENPFSQNCFAYPNVEFDLAQICALKFDAVFISHYHDDHCSFVSLDLLDRRTPIYLYCVFEEMFELIRELGFENVNSLVLGEVVRIGGFEVTPLMALDSDVDCIFQIAVGGLKVLNVVDSWIAPSTMSRLATSSPWDLVLWPFQTMREVGVLAPKWASAICEGVPHEWIAQLRALRPKVVVPSSCQFIHESWSWYNRAMFPISYREFSQVVGAALPTSQIVRLNPAMTFEFDSRGWRAGQALKWVNPLGDQDVDYRYDEKIVPPATAEIAQHFPALSMNQREFIKSYCEVGLPARYKALSYFDGSYFNKPRLWRLSVFERSGDPTVYTYRIDGNLIELLGASEDSLSWATEIAAYKLFSALKNGEALTSLYVRINDTDFDRSVAGELAAADVLEDPLVRCLYEGVFGAYQTAQLRRVKSTSSISKK